MKDEQRKRQRIDFQDYILCYKHIVTNSNVKPDNGPIRIQIKDISYSGMGIACNRDLGMGDFLLFNLRDKGEVKEFMVEVKWCKYTGGGYEAGLHFMNLTKDMILFLDVLIKSHIGRKKKQLGQAI